MKKFNFISKRKRGIGNYPSCDHINRAIELLLEHPKANKNAILELCYAITKADGYIYPYIREKLKFFDIWGDE